MNPLVSQPNDGPPAMGKNILIVMIVFFKLIKLRIFIYIANQSMSLVSFVKTHASSKNIIAA